MKRELHRYALSELEYEIIKELCNNDLNVSRTAEAMNYHRNSLNYHIDIIKKITGQDPTSFWGATKLLVMISGQSTPKDV